MESEKLQLENGEIFIGEWTSPCANVALTKLSDDEDGPDQTTLLEVNRVQLTNKRCVFSNTASGSGFFLNYFNCISHGCNNDFFFVQVVPLYCSILIELNKVGELYYLAHNLVSANPDLAVAWFAVVSQAALFIRCLGNLLLLD